MVTQSAHSMMKLACSEDLKLLSLPLHSDHTPIPGLLLMMDDGHRKLEMILSDGRCVDLLKVYTLAEDLVRNWRKGSELPAFIADFKRLVPLTEALNGRRP